MAKTATYRTPKLKDSTIIDLATEIEANEELENLSMSFQFGELTMSLEQAKEMIGKGAGTFIQGLYVTVQSNAIVISFNRGILCDSAKVDQLEPRQSSPYFDEIAIRTNSQNGANVSTAAAVYAIVSKYISKPLPAAKGAGSQSAIDLIQAEIVKLADLQRETYAKAQEVQAKFEQTQIERRQEIDQDDQARRKAFEEYKSKELEELNQDREKLKEEKKEFDDRNNTHVRRQLRQTINEQVSKRVNNTLIPRRSTYEGYLLIALALTVAFASAFFAYVTLEQASRMLIPPSEGKPGIDPMLLWLTIAKGLIGTTVSIAFLVYALSTLKRIHHDNLTISNELQLYAMDINRASWVVETIMEFASVNEREPPDKWIEGVCHGLFHASGNVREPITPLEAWGTLLNVAGKAEYGPDGPKLEFSRAQAKKASKGPSKPED